MRRTSITRFAAVVAGLLPLFTSAHDVADNLQNPSPAVRPKVRTRATEADLVALAHAGFGGAEVFIDWRLRPEQTREQLHQLLQVARHLSLQLDLSPGGSQPYQGAGVSEAGSMQELVTAAETVPGG